MTAICIPASNGKPVCKKLLDGLLQSIVDGKYLEEGWNIYVAFDGCDDFFVGYFTTKFPFIVVDVNPNKPYGFAKNANIVARKAHKEGHDVFILNMDTCLPDVSLLSKVRGTGLATPAQCQTPDPTCEKVTFSNTPWGLLRQEPPRKPSIKFAGFCMYLSKELMDKIGYLDEGFIATFEDDDICVRAALAGFPVEEVGINVHHYGSATGAYDNNRLSCSAIRFRMKWDIPVIRTDDKGDPILDASGKPIEITHADFNQFILDNHVWDDSMKEP